MWLTKSWNSLVFVNAKIWSADSTLNKFPTALRTSATFIYLFIYYNLMANGNTDILEKIDVIEKKRRRKVL